MTSHSASRETDLYDAGDSNKSEFLEILVQGRRIREEKHNLSEVIDQRAFRYEQLGFLKDQRAELKETHKGLVEKLELCEVNMREREQQVKDLEWQMGSSRTTTVKDTLILTEAYKEFRTSQKVVYRTTHEVSKSDGSIENNTKDISSIERQINSTTAKITALERKIRALESEAKSDKERRNAMKRIGELWQGEGGRELIDWIRIQPALTSKVFNLQEMARFAKWLPDARQAILLLNNEIIKHSSRERQGVPGQSRHRGLFPLIVKNAIDRLKHVSCERNAKEADRALLDDFISELEIIDDAQLNLYGLHYAKCSMLEKAGSCA